MPTPANWFEDATTPISLKDMHKPNVVGSERQVLEVPHLLQKVSVQAPDVAPTILATVAWRTLQLQFKQAISNGNLRWLRLRDLSLFSGLFKQVRSLTNGSSWQTLGVPLSELGCPPVREQGLPVGIAMLRIPDSNLRLQGSSSPEDRGLTFAGDSAV